ncbi:hypothetical protein U6B65_12560 [Oscillospiraceae bacterium MB08-C2-2]|nr:hypothetical protein U6B65_12560 [Oscillospiraceae bacterium MB08-C2-2]
MDWKEVNTQKDIDELLGAYGNFHDSCITNLRYDSGSYVTSDKAMHFSGADDRNLIVAFQCQWDPITIELCFSGLRRLHLVGWQDNYLNNISSAYLAFHEKLLPGKPERLIVWSDTDGFEPKTVSESNALTEPADTYMISNRLKWRIID